MNRAVLAVAFTLLSLPLSAATVGESTGINSALGVAPTTKDFVQEAASSDMFEVESSKLASTKLQGADKTFAEQMVADHTKTSMQLSTEAKADNIPVPAALDSTHQGWLDKLKGLSGNDFKKEYFSDQVSAHETAVSLFKRYGGGGENAKLKSWAETTLPTLEHHLDMARGLYKNT